MKIDTSFRQPQDLQGWTMLGLGHWPARWAPIEFTSEGLAKTRQQAAL
ncbi:MAG: hypothetical protein JNL98_17885 [Bryobacterales bacterium]|nr:hypothetical protein [Bryobacterales bacterium]